jgi:Transcriptional regulators
MSLNELRMMNEKDHSLGISYHSLLILNLIAYTENCTVSKLADMLQITISGAVIKVGELVKKGCVEKIQSNEDKRVFYLKISPKFADVYGKFDCITRNMDIVLKKKYSENELALFIDMLHTIAEYDWRTDNAVP